MVTRMVFADDDCALPSERMTKPLTTNGARIRSTLRQAPLLLEPIYKDDICESIEAAEHLPIDLRVVALAR